MSAAAELPPWLVKLSPKSRAAIAEGVTDWPPLTERQRDRLQLLLRPKRSDHDLARRGDCL